MLKRLPFKTGTFIHIAVSIFKTTKILSLFSSYTNNARNIKVAAGAAVATTTRMTRKHREKTSVNI
jgi:hypothetical protein